MKKIKKFIQENKYLCLMVCFIVAGVFVLYLPSFLNGKYYVGGGDIKTQNYEYYLLAKRTTIEALKSGTLPFYSFILFLGNNIWASKPDYLFDPFNIITYIIPFDFYFINDFICIVKLAVAGIGTYLLIKKLYKNEKVAAICGFLFAMSSYGIYFTSQPAFLSFFALVPFYFLGIEDYFHKKKKYLFIAMVFLMFLISYYLFFALTIFTPVYFIYRYYNINGTLKGMFKSAFVLVFYYLIGCLLSCFSLVPGAIYVLGNDRVGKSSVSFAFEDIKIYLHLIFSRLVPSQSYIYGNNIFDNSSHTIKEMCLFTSSIVSLLLPQVFVDKDKKFKVSTLILFAVNLMILFIPYGDSLMNGLSEICFRWTFIIIFIDIFVAAKYLNNFSEVNRKLLHVTVIVNILLICFSFAAAIITSDSSFAEYKAQISIAFITILFTVLMASIKNKKVIVCLIVAEVFVAAGIKGYNSIETGLSKSYIVASETVLSDGRDYNQLSDYLDSLDEENSKQFYRVYVPYDTVYWANSTNFNIVYNIKGLMTYDSLFAPSFSQLRDTVREGVTRVLSWDFDIQNVDLINLYSTKYSLTTNEEEIPFENYEIVDYYRDCIFVAENLDYRSLGITYTDSISLWEFETEKDNDPHVYLDTVVCYYGVEDYIKDEERHEMYDINYGNNSVSGKVNTKEQSFIVISLPYEKGWTIKVNGKDTYYYNVNGGLIGFPVEKGENTIEMSFVPDGFKEGCILSLTGVALLGVIIFIDLYKTKKQGSQ